MQADLEKLDGLKRRLKVVVPASEVQQAYQAKLKKLSKSIRIDGFRPGKVPADVIESRFKSGLTQEVAGELIQSHLEKAVKEQEIKLAGHPQVEPEALLKDSDFQFVAEFEVYPEITLQDLENETIEKEVASVTDQDIEQALHEIQKQHADWEEVSRASQEGDRLTVDFKGFVDDEPFEGGQASEFKLELGSKQMIPGFEEGLIGVARGEDKDLTVKFPDDYHAEDLKGKQALFKVTVHKVHEPVLPMIDDNLAEKAGVEGGLEKLKAEIKVSMQAKLNQAVESHLKQQVFDKLLEKNQLTIPQSLLDAEIDHLQEMTRQQMSHYSGKEAAPKVDLPREPYQDEARKRVSLGLLLAEVIEAYEIKLDEDKLLSKVEEIAAAYQSPSEMVSFYYKNKKLLSEVEAVVLESQAVEQLLQKVQLIEKPCDYDAVMKAQ